MWNIKKTVNRLNYLCKYLDNRMYINYGGCCYLAYLIFTELDRYKIPCYLVIQSYDKKSISKISKEIRFLKRDPANSSQFPNVLCGSHYCVATLHNKYINKLECINHNYTIHNITSNEIKHIYNLGIWSNVYDIKFNHMLGILIKGIFTNEITFKHNKVYIHNINNIIKLQRNGKIRKFLGRCS